VFPGAGARQQARAAAKKGKKKKADK
jgi:hypothetical protein